MDDQGAQGKLFEVDEFLGWKEHWKGMPEYIHRDFTPWNSVIIHFEDRESMDALSRILGQRLTEKTQSIWFPEATIGRMVDKRYRDTTEDQALPDGRTGGIVYADWTNHETWMTALLILDDEAICRAAESSLDISDDNEKVGNVIRGFASDIIETKAYDPDVIDWPQIVRVFRFRSGRQP